MEKFKLSFDDSSKIESRKGNKTTVVLRPYVKFNVFNNLISATNSQLVHDAFKKRGFDYDYRLGGLSARVKASVMLMDGDVDDQVVATRLATTKAKLKCFRLVRNIVDEVATEAINRANEMTSHLNELNRLVDNEEDGLDNCIKTGFCDSNR